MMEPISRKEHFLRWLFGTNVAPGTVKNAYCSNTGDINLAGSKKYIGLDTLIEVAPGKTYTISTENISSVSGLNVSYFDADKAFLSRVSSSPATITTLDTCHYIFVHFYDSTAPYTVNGTEKIWVNKGSTSLAYEPYYGDGLEPISREEQFIVDIIKDRKETTLEPLSTAEMAWSEGVKGNADNS